MHSYECVLSTHSRVLDSRNMLDVLARTQLYYFQRRHSRFHQYFKLCPQLYELNFLYTLSNFSHVNVFASTACRAPSFAFYFAFFIYVILSLTSYFIIRSSPGDSRTDCEWCYSRYSSQSQDSMGRLDAVC